VALVLAGASVLTMDAADRLIPSADIRVEGTDIVAIESPGVGRQPGDQVIDCAETLVIPGLVNTHTHSCAIILRGLAEDLPRSHWTDFYAVPGQDRFGADDYVAGAGIACGEMLLNGVTCIADRWSYMERIGEAIELSGIRAVLGPTIQDASGPADWRSTDAVFERWGADPRRRISAGLAPHAVNTVSDELQRRLAAEAERRRCRVFIHVAQSEREVADVRMRGYEGTLACLAANGLTGAHVVAAHCIYLSPAEIAEWPRHRISIAHCPASNIKIEGRTLALAKLLGKVAIGIGTDWAASDNAMDMLAECRLAALVGKLLDDDPQALPVNTMLRMATIDGARVLGLDDVIGSIEVGKRADLVVIDLARLAANPRHVLAANLLYSIGTSAIRDVLVDGEILVRNHRLTRSREPELARSLHHLTKR
jgi:5-methylthioadenosine/S-adenosylhomocysteine deaminase